MDQVDPVSFKESLDVFLRTQGLLPFSELYASNPGFVSDVTHGLPRWDKNFPYSWRKGAGFVAVELNRPYNPIEVDVGASQMRVDEGDELEHKLVKWLNSEYPRVTVVENKVTFVRFPW